MGNVKIREIHDKISKQPGLVNSLS